MAISFNNIPTSQRTPGAFADIDNSRALQGLAQNPHKVLIVGQKIAAGTAAHDSLVPISSDGLANGFFGPGSVLARMCNVFKDNNPNTELFAMALGSGIAGTAAAGNIDFSGSLDGNLVSGAGTLFLMINGKGMDIALTSGMSGFGVASLVASTINADSTLPVTAAASFAAASGGNMEISAVNSGTLGNDINVRFNYYAGQSFFNTFSGVTETSAVYSQYTSMAGGATDPDLDDAWAVIEDERFNYIINPYNDATNLTSLEGEFADRFLPLVDKQGHGFGAARKTAATATTLGNSRNSPHNTIMCAYDSPTCSEEWAAVLGAEAAFALNNDPARPLTGILLKGILPPPTENRFTRAEREVLLYDGIATFTVNAGSVYIERCITTYQTNALGIVDPSYLDVQTLATLGEIRDQYRTRMTNRFIAQRFKLADDGFPVQPGSFVTTPSNIRLEIIALFTQLRDIGLIENLDDFITNLVVERNASDRNRVDALLPPDLINQFRIVAGLIQFIL